MKTIAALALGAFVVGCGLVMSACGGSEERAIGRLEAVRDRICACRDLECINAASDERDRIMYDALMAAGGKDAPKTAETFAKIKPLADLDEEITRCERERKRTLRGQ